MIKLDTLDLILRHILVMEPHRFGIIITCVQTISANPVVIFCSNQLITFKTVDPIQLRADFQKCRISGFGLVIRIGDNISNFKLHFTHYLIRHIIRIF
ncbi:hypothetical protein D3C76_838010 [compost metagenome]